MNKQSQLGIYCVVANSTKDREISCPLEDVILIFTRGRNPFQLNGFFGVASALSPSSISLMERCNVLRLTPPTVIKKQVCLRQ